MNCSSFNWVVCYARSRGITIISNKQIGQIMKPKQATLLSSLYYSEGTPNGLVEGTGSFSSGLLKSISTILLGF